MRWNSSRCRSCGPHQKVILGRSPSPCTRESRASLQTQTTLCREYASAHGYEVDEAHVYRETYSGAELWDRPHLTSIRKSIRERDIDVLVCYAIDRLSRDPVHLGVILTEADRYCVAVEFVSEPLDDSPEGQLIRFVRGYAARVEREKARERTIRGKRARLESGKIHGFGGELYGYRRDRRRWSRCARSRICSNAGSCRRRPIDRASPPPATARPRRSDREQRPGWHRRPRSG